MANFYDHIGPLIDSEGGYKLTNIKHDRGGRTYAGISEKANPDWEGWILVERLKTAPLDKKSNIQVRLENATETLYKKEYWDILQLDQVKSDEIAGIIFSMGVNSGIITALKIAQKTVGVPQDGLIGPQTLNALNSIDEEIFCMRYGIFFIERYSRIVRKYPNQIKFLRGWINRVLKVLGIKI